MVAGQRGVLGLLPRAAGCGASREVNAADNLVRCPSQDSARSPASDASVYGIRVRVALSRPQPPGRPPGRSISFRRLSAGPAACIPTALRPRPIAYHPASTKNIIEPW